MLQVKKLILVWPATLVGVLIYTQFFLLHGSLYALFIIQGVIVGYFWQLIDPPLENIKEGSPVTIEKLVAIMQMTTILLMLGAYCVNKPTFCFFLLGYLNGFSFTLFPKGPFQSIGFIWNYVQVKLISHENKEWLANNEWVFQDEDTAFIFGEQQTDCKLQIEGNVDVEIILYENSLGTILRHHPCLCRAYSRMTTKILRCHRQRKHLMMFERVCTLPGNKMTPHAWEITERLKENFLSTWRVQI